MGAVKKFTWSLLLLILLFLILFVIGAQAAPAKGWVKIKNKCYYYENNKPVTGLYKIGTKEYFFDSKGVQKTSWRKVGKNYYCFASLEKENGFMLKNMKKNGIYLGDDGKARLSSDRARKKAALMVRVSDFLDHIITNNKKEFSSRRDKLKECYDYLRKNYPYRFVSHFRENDPNWDLWSVEALLKRGYADCHPFACTFAYLANALGYSDVKIHSWHTLKYGNTGHSWVILNGDVYDVSLGRHNKSSYALFGMDYEKYRRKYPYYHVNSRRSLDKL